MFVIKRDGSKEEVNFEKISQRITKQTKNLKNIDPNIISQKVIQGLYDGVSSKELDLLSMETAYAMSISNPEYDKLALRLAISTLHKETSGTFSGVINKLYNITDTHGQKRQLIADDVYKIVKKNAHLLDNAIDYKRDYLFDYFGFKTLERSYLLKINGKIAERPQHMWMRVAVGIHKGDIEAAIHTYEMLSTLQATHATPTLFNAGTVKNQLSSCFLLGVDDSISGIYDALKECAAISQNAGGIGIWFHDIRAKGSYIYGTGGSSNGIIPALKVFESTAKYVDQCFAGDTVVYTEGCAKLIKDINVGDKLLTHKNNYKEVKKVLKTHYTGQMISISVGQFTVKVKPEHQFLVIQGSKITDIKHKLNVGLAKLEWVEAEKLNENDLIAFPRQFNPFDENMIIIEENRYAFDTINSISIVDFDDIVYDFEVEDDHSYLTEIGIAHNGGGKRKGSFAIYLEPWHADIFEFLDLRKNNGKEEVRARDLNLALWTPDLFFKRVEIDESWTLMDPNKCPGLSNVYGEEFDKLYSKYESEGKGEKTVKARELWTKILESCVETGEPYILAKDACNLKSNQKNIGTIKSSNLCVAGDTELNIKYSLDDKEPSTILIKDVVDLIKNGKKVYVESQGLFNSIYSEIVDAGMTNNNAHVIKLTIKLHDGDYKELICTKDHEIYTKNRGYIKAEDLLIFDDVLILHNDILNIYDKDNKKINLVKSVSKQIPVYDITVKDTHNFFANGILVHNCAEIIEYSDSQIHAMCNLASISLPSCIDGKKNKKFNFERLYEITKTLTENLNKVIDVEYYPTEGGKKSNLRDRPIGIGIQGLSVAFIELKYAWESPEATQLNKDIFETMYYAALRTSCDLAKKDCAYKTFKGSPASQGILQFDVWGITPSAKYDWDKLKEDIKKYGLKNSLLTVVVPTASTSQILGNTESIEPFTSNIFKRSTLSGEFIQVNKLLVDDLLELGLWNNKIRQKITADNGSVQNIEEIPDDIKKLYKTIWEIPQKTIIDMAAGRGPYICQSQSMNLYFKDINYAKLTSAFFYAWKAGLKTIVYYTRSQAAREATQITIDVEDKMEDGISCSLDNPENCEACGS